MIKHSQQFVGKMPTNSLSVFDNFMRLLLKWLRQDFHLQLKFLALLLLEDSSLLCKSESLGIKDCSDKHRAELSFQKMSSSHHSRFPGLLFL